MRNARPLPCNETIQRIVAGIENGGIGPVVSPVRVPGNCRCHGFRVDGSNSGGSGRKKVVRQGGSRVRHEVTGTESSGYGPSACIGGIIRSGGLRDARPLPGDKAAEHVVIGSEQRLRCIVVNARWVSDNRCRDRFRGDGACARGHSRQQVVAEIGAAVRTKVSGVQQGRHNPRACI